MSISLRAYNLFFSMSTLAGRLGSNLVNVTNGSLSNMLNKVIVLLKVCLFGTNEIAATVKLLIVVCDVCATVVAVDCVHPMSLDTYSDGG